MYMKKKICTLLALLLAGMYVVWAQEPQPDAGYTLYFDANGGTGNMSPMTFTSVDDTLPLTVNAFTRTGYTFAGWNTEAAGTGTAYTDRQEVSHLTLDTTITLYAQWTANTYTVKFDRNGGYLGNWGQDMDEQTFTYDQEQALSQNLYGKAFHDFHGWNTEANGTGTGYADQQEVKNLTAEPGGTVTLYAQWDFTAFTIEFEGNGGIGAEMTALVVNGEGVTLPANTYTRRGYVFTGWNTEADGGGTSVADQGTATDVATGASTVTLYAQWRPITFTIHYDPNVPEGGQLTGDPLPDQTLTWDTTDTLATPGFTYRGHNFVYWSSQAIVPDDEAEAEQIPGFDVKEEIEANNILNELSIEPRDGAEVTLYAQWESIVYHVSFYANADDAAGTMDSQNINYDEQTALTPNAFTRPGYQFDCWSTSADSNTPGEGVAVYEDGAEVFNLLETFNGEYSLYAHWTPITYHIIYNANRGEGTGEGDMQPQLFTYATPQALTANAFTRMGYSFTGWNMRPNGTGRALTDGQVVDSLVTVAGRDTTLYAQWQANTYHVAFHRNNLRATGDMDLQAFTYDQEQALAANLFQHPDSSFLGWSTDSTSTVVIYSDRQPVVNLTAEPADTLALYAVWGGREYIVHFHANADNVEGSMENQRLTYSVETPLTPNAFTRPGFTFAGWALSSAGQVAYRDGEAVSNLADEAGAQVDLYAVWTENEYTIVFRGGNGEGSMDNLHLTYTEQTTLPANGFTLEGYTFAGWNTASDGSGTLYADRAEVQGITTNANERVYLYAQWTANRYTLRFLPNGGEGTMDDLPMTYNDRELLPGNSFVRTGFSFTGWNTAPDGTGAPYADGTEVVNLTATPDTVIDLYAQWSEHYYTIHYHKGIDAATGTMDDQRLAYTDRIALRSCGFLLPGYTFTGWSDGQGGTYRDGQTVTRLTETDEAVIDLTAQWTANAYTIRFDGNGGEGDMSELHLTYDDDPIALTSNAFTRTGYTYTGWNTAADGTGTAYADAQEVHNLSATPGVVITLYAQWQAHTYTVRFDGNGGEGDMADLPIAYDETATLTPNAFTRTGYTYLGWNTAADGTGTPYADGETVNNWTEEDGATIILYAQWQAHTYTVMYAPNGGTGHMERQSFTYGEEQALLPNAFTRTGYTFAGWNTGEQGTGTAYADGQTVVNLTAEDGAFVGLYAQWTPLRYTVRFLHEDGTELQSSEWDYGTMPVYTGITPEKASTDEYEYAFAGWSPEITAVTGEATYTARFTATRRTYTVTFVSEGETLQTDVLEYGEMPYYRGDEPQKPADEENEYTFAGWSPEVTTVTGDATYTTLFDAQPHTGLATLDGGGMTLRVEALTLFITGIGDREEVMVYDPEGRPVYRGTDRHIALPAPGIYLVCRPGETQKVWAK